MALIIPDGALLSLCLLIRAHQCTAMYTYAMRQPTSALVGAFSSLGKATGPAVRCHVSTSPLYRKENTAHPKSSTREFHRELCRFVVTGQQRSALRQPD
ncbi:hypothetical protein V8E52_007008 [Russula decolorans]